MKRQPPGTGIFVIRACHSHSGRRPRIGRTSGGYAFDWLGIHLSFRREIGP
jgi:hypothetical protein